MSKGEESLALLMRAHGITGFEREYRFHPVRRWRFDFAWPDTPMVAAEGFKLAVEVEGLGGGRHQRTPGFIKDIEKYTAALNEGWIVWRITAAMTTKQSTIDTLKHLLKT